MMKEYIESIIEIILEDVSCEHELIEEFPRGPKHDDPTYCLKDENAVIEKCIKAIPARLIERPEITEKWVEEKVMQIMLIFYTKGINYEEEKSRTRGTISSLLNELSAKINLIGKEESCKGKDGNS